MRRARRIHAADHPHGRARGRTHAAARPSGLPVLRAPVLMAPILRAPRAPILRALLLGVVAGALRRGALSLSEPLPLGGEWLSEPLPLRRHHLRGRTRAWLSRRGSHRVAMEGGHGRRVVAWAVARYP